MQALDRDRTTSALRHYCDQLGHFKRSVQSESNTTSSSGSSLFGIISNNNIVDIRKSRANGGKTTVESREHRFHRNATKKSASRDQAALAATRSRVPSYDFSDDTLDDNYVSHDDILRNVQDYTSALDFGVDMSAEMVELLLPQQASPGVTSPGGASPAEISPGGVTPEGSSPPLTPSKAQAPASALAPGPAPTPASAALIAINGDTNRGTVGVTPANTHSRAVSLLPGPVATHYGRGCNNNRVHRKRLGIDQH